MKIENMGRYIKNAPLLIVMSPDLVAQILRELEHFSFFGLRLYLPATPTSTSSTTFGIIVFVLVGSLFLLSIQVLSKI